MSKKTIEFSLEGKEAKPKAKPKAKEGDERKRRSQLLNKIKAYQKHNQIEVDTSPADFDSDFKESLHFLEDLSKTRKRKQGAKHRKTQRVEEPKYGCLKNGTKPTYRQLEPVQAPVAPAPVAPAPVAPAPVVQAPVVQAPVVQAPVPVVPVPVVQAPAPVAPVVQAPAPVAPAPVAPAPVAPVPVVQQAPAPVAPVVQQAPAVPAKRVKTSKYHLGKQKKKVSVLIKNRKTRKRIEHEDKQLLETDVAKMRSHLIERNLYKAGSLAPNDVIKQLYRQSILAGDVSNKNGETLVHNFMR